MKNPFFLFFLISLIYSCNDLRLTNLTGLIYGTTYNIQFYNSNSDNFSKEIDSIFNVIDNSMSTYKPNSIISKILEPYYSTKVGNSGLGLAITKKIIDDHNGIILINPLKGSKGMSVTLKFPLISKLKKEKNK